MRKTTTILICVISLMIAHTAFAKVYPSGKEYIPPSYQIMHFARGSAEIQPFHVSNLTEILKWAKENPAGRIELQGKFSSPPNYSQNNILNQTNLALWRAWSVKDWLVANGAPNPTRILVYKPSRGTTGNAEMDQCVDVYFVKNDMIQISSVEHNEIINCPPGYEGELTERGHKQTGDIVYVSYTVECKLTNPSLINTLPGSTTPGGTADLINKTNFLEDPRYWVHTGAGTLGGCGIGFILANQEPGEGGGNGGDGGSFCENDTTCIVSSCVVGWAVGQVTYLIDTSYRNSKNNP